jgi:hypothetical protein
MSEDSDQSALLCDGNENRSQNNGRKISQAGKTRWQQSKEHRIGPGAILCVRAKKKIGTSVE